MDNSLGSISARIILQEGSPVTSDAVTNSRLRIERVCARRTRAPHGQLVRATTSATMRVELLKNWTATIARGSEGMTRKTLVISDKMSSVTPPKYPLERPTATAIATTAR